jgi:AhpD family alkylhydroperoxidase
MPPSESACCGRGATTAAPDYKPMQRKPKGEGSQQLQGPRCCGSMRVCGQGSRSRRGRSPRPVLEGTVPAKYKELMRLTASAVLRCDDCINYHVIQSYRLGMNRAEQEEAINVALVVGGSIAFRICAERMSCWWICTVRCGKRRTRVFAPSHSAHLFENDRLGRFSGRYTDRQGIVLVCL